MLKPASGTRFSGGWVSTIFNAAQMVVTPAAACISTVLGTRRVLLWTGAISTACFAVAALCA